MSADARPAPPMSEARRQYVHGKVHPQDRTATVPDLLLHGLPGALLVGALFVVATLLIVSLSPAASDATSRASAPSVRVAEAGADQGRR